MTSRRSLQRLRPTDWRTQQVCTPVYPDSVLPRAIARVYADRPTGNYTERQLLNMVDKVIAEDRRCVLGGLADLGFSIEHARLWTTFPSLGPATSRRDRDLLITHARLFRGAGHRLRDSIEWWDTFTNPWRSLAYADAGRAPYEASAIFQMFLSPDTYTHSVHTQRSDELREADAWVLSGIPLERCGSYRRLGVSVTEALTEWEPKHAKDGYDVDAALVSLAGLGWGEGDL